MKRYLAILCVILSGCATAHLETRVYSVGDIFWRSITPYQEVAPGYTTTDAKDSEDLQEFLEKADARFTNGSFIKVDRANSTVKMRSTPEVLDRLEVLLGPMDGSGVFYEKRLK